MLLSNVIVAKRKTKRKICVIGPVQGYYVVPARSRTVVQSVSALDCVCVAWGSSDD
jgi:hypothetical protein